MPKQNQTITGKVTIDFGRDKSGKYYCGIGDGIHDGLQGCGRTMESAMRNFIKKYNGDKNFNFCQTYGK